MRAARAPPFPYRGATRMDPATVVNGAVFSSSSTGMVIVRDIEFYSMCEHHILPFFGKISIGYMPRGKYWGLASLVGLSISMRVAFSYKKNLTRGIAGEISRAAESPDVMSDV